MQGSFQRLLRSTSRLASFLGLSIILVIAARLGHTSQPTPSGRGANTKPLPSVVRLRINSSGEVLAGRWLVFSPDGSVLATASYRTHLWDVATGKYLRELCPRPYGAPLCRNALHFTPDGRSLLSTSCEGTLSLWDVATGKKVRDVYTADTGMMIESFVPSPDGSQLLMEIWKTGGLTIDKDHLDDIPRFHLYDFKRCKLVRSFQRATYRGSFTGMYSGRLAWAPDGKIVAAADQVGTMVLWNVTTGEILREIPIPDTSWEVTGIAFSPDRKYLISCEALNSSQNHGGGPRGVPHEGKALRIRDVTTGKERFSIPGPFGAPLISPDGRMIAASGIVWEFATGQKVLDFSAEEGGGIQDLAFAPDGKSLAAAVYARSGYEDPGRWYVLIWDLKPPDWHPPTAPLSADSLPALWKTLADNDAAKAFRAVLSLSAQPVETIPFLKDRLAPVPAATPERIQQLIADLDDDRFQRREAASTELASLGPHVAPALREALANSPSLELRRRAEPLLQDLKHWEVKAPEVLRAIRAVWVLQRIGTPEARALLDKLACGEPAARQTQEAKAALHFLDRIQKHQKPGQQ